MRYRKAIMLLFLVMASLSSLSAGGNKESKSYSNTSASVVKKASKRVFILLQSDGSYKEQEVAEGEAAESYANAVGVKYLDSEGKVVSIVWFTEETRWLGRWIDTIANAMNTITYHIVMAIHPFPSTIYQLYDYDTTSTSYEMTVDKSRMQSFDETSLLIHNQYYSRTYLNEYEHYQIPIAELNKGTSLDKLGSNYSSALSKVAQDAPFQRYKWSIVTMLFLTLFIAEVLFTAIWGYVTGTSENILKDVAKKAGITLALFILTSALPYLVEAMRYGLFKIADMFYGPSASQYYTESSIISPMSSPEEIFNMPGRFLEQMKFFFQSSNSEYGTSALSSALAGTSGYQGADFFKTLIVWLLYLVFRFFMFFTVLKCSIHIALNIIEVYILLGLTMILVPFSVFEPTKPLGAKCIMSLVTNLVECFVIVVMLTCVVPAVTAVTSSLLQNGIQTADDSVVSSEIAMDYTYASPDLSIWETESVDGDGANSIYVPRIFAGDGWLALTLWNSNSQKIAYVYRTKSINGDSSNSQSAKEKSILSSENVNVYFVITDSMMEDGKITKEELETGINAMEGTTLKGKSLSGNIKSTNVSRLTGLAEAFYRSTVSTMGNSSSSIPTDPLTLNGTAENKMAFLRTFSSILLSGNASSYIADLSANSYWMKGISAYSTDATCRNASTPRKYSGTIYGQSNSIMMFLQLTVIFMSMYIPCFFIQQSTQITNSLMNGTAAMESFANAISGIAQKTYQGAGKLAGRAMSLGGNIAGTGLQTAHNKHAKGTPNTTESISENVQSIAASLQKQADATAKNSSSLDAGGDGGENSAGGTGSVGSEFNR